MDKKDVNFLKNLQCQLLTQPTDGNRNPRFWGISYDELIWGMDPEYADGWFVYSGENVCTVGEPDNLQSVMDELLDPDGYGLDKEDFENWDVTDIEDVVKAANEVLSVFPSHVPLTLIWYKKIRRVSKNALFLTKRACQEHIQRYSHRYQNPHTYVMTASDCPEYEQLLKILAKTDWDQFAEK